MLLNMSAENEHINYSEMSKNWNKLNRPPHTLPEHWSYICIHKALFSMQKCSSEASSVSLLGRTPWKQGRECGVLLGHSLSFVPVSHTLRSSHLSSQNVFSFMPHTRCTWITGWKGDGNAGRAHSFSLGRFWVLGVCVYPRACSSCWVHFSFCRRVFLYACHSV